MVKQLRCARCGTLHSETGLFPSDPEACRECGFQEFEVLGAADAADPSVAWWEGLANLDTLVMFAMGIAILNVIPALLGGFMDNRYMMGSAGASFVVLLATAMFLSRRTKASWFLALVVFATVLLGGAYVAVVTRGFGEVLFQIYGGIYVLLGVVGLAIALGGRDEIAGLTAE